ncbi:hypothetical protein PAMA_016959 [Pampus argenteus]
MAVNYEKLQGKFVSSQRPTKDEDQIDIHDTDLDPLPPKENDFQQSSQQWQSEYDALPLLPEGGAGSQRDELEEEMQTEKELLCATWLEKQFAINVNEQEDVKTDEKGARGVEENNK